MITHITTFQPSDFKAIATVNVTVLLVLTTLFISIFNALPRTSYVKAVDFWLITNLMIPFFEMILQSLINVLHKDDELNNGSRVFMAPNLGIKNMDNSSMSDYGRGQEKEKLMNLLRFLTIIVLPAFYILFCISFFVYGIMV